MKRESKRVNDKTKKDGKDDLEIRSEKEWILTC